jgi:hypothetical protein
MNVSDFRRIALSFEGAEESSHMGNPDFRVGGRIFATLASAKQGFGNLMLTVEQQAAFVEELPEVFVPVAGGWGRMGMTHIRLAVADEEVLAGALRTAWKLRVEKNAKSGKKRDGPPKGSTPAKREASVKGGATINGVAAVKGGASAKDSISTKGSRTAKSARGKRP